MSDNDTDRQRRIADIEATLRLPVPDSIRQRLEAELRSLISFAGAQTGDISIRDVAGGDITSIEQQTNQSISGKASVGTAIGRDIHGNIYINTPGPDANAAPPQAYVAAEVSDLRRQALLAHYQKDWHRAADLLARVIELDGDDTSMAQLLSDARSYLRIKDRYAVARALREAGEWRAVLSALDEIARIDPQASDLDKLRTWAEDERAREIWEPRFGPVYREVAADHYDEAIQVLTRRLATAPGDQEAIRAAAALIEDTTIAAPARIRVASGELLAQYGDPRPGVCNLPPPMVPIKAGRFVIGISQSEYEQIVADEQANNQGEEATGWYKWFLDNQPITIAAFELARYPVTNAQYKLFIDAGGYDPDASWWRSGAEWLREAKVSSPSFWIDAGRGIDRPNHPVVGVSWYEAIAFCFWLTQYLNDDYIYMLPSEPEWEYAARGSERRIYPWGNTIPDSERAHFDQEYNGTTAVGCFPAGATPETGLLDMAGNVWEWTRSEYRPYPYDPGDGREDGRESSKKQFTLRGGFWYGIPIDLRAIYRCGISTDSEIGNVGFRLARRKS